MQVEPRETYVELEVEEESSAKPAEDPNTPNSERHEALEEVLEESLEPTSTSEPSLRRLTRIRQKPERYNHKLTLVSTEQQDPHSVAEAESSPDKAKCHGKGNAVTSPEQGLGVG